MASLAKLRRRALRWDRYEHRAYGPSCGVIHRGRERCVLALWAERDRRRDGWWPTEDWSDDPEPYRPIQVVTVVGGLL